MIPFPIGEMDHRKSRLPSTSGDVLRKFTHSPPSPAAGFSGSCLSYNLLSIPFPQLVSPFLHPVEPCSSGCHDASSSIQHCWDSRFFTLSEQTLIFIKFNADPSKMECVFPCLFKETILNFNEHFIGHLSSLLGTTGLQQML